MRAAPVLASVAATLIAASSGLAANIVINPTSGDLVSGITVNSTAASAKMKASNTNWDMSLSPTTSTSGSFPSFLSRNVSNSMGTLTAAWNFTLAFTASVGYELTMTSAADATTGTITWRMGDAQINGVSAETLGGENALRSFNFIRLHARASGTGQEMVFSNLALDIATQGVFLADTVTPTVGARSSINGDGGAGFAYQDILSDVDLSQLNWALTGTFETNVATNSETLRFQIDMLNADFALQTTIIPLPTGAGLAIAGLLAVGARRRRAL
ncbi:MAG: hypothetical protein IBJ10_08010 [Phycisphaerales bacterium]|nr:hypothetical protein [Phycisphaerales bacterium]